MRLFLRGPLLGQVGTDSFTAKESMGTKPGALVQAELRAWEQGLSHGHGHGGVYGKCPLAGDKSGGVGRQR